MADLPSRLDIQNVGQDFLLQRARKIDPRQVLVEGSDANLFVGSGAAMAHAVVNQLAYATGRLLLDGARGEDLDRYVFDRYRFARKGASPSLATVRAYRPTSGPAGSILVGTKVKTRAGVEFITTTTITFATGDLSKTGDVRATQAGTATKVGANTIRQFEFPQLLFDPTLKLNNDAKSAGGEDIEDDDLFRERARGFWAAARRGTLGAIEFGALQVDGVVSAQAVEALNGSGQPARFVNLYIADSSGVANAALARAVQIQLLDFRCGGIYVAVSPSLPAIVDVVLDLTFQSNVDTDSLAELVRSAVVEYINSLPVNGTLDRGAIQSVLTRYRPDGLIPNERSIVVPTGDVVPEPGQTLRTTLDNVVLAAA